MERKLLFFFGLFVGITFGMSTERLFLDLKKPIEVEEGWAKLGKPHEETEIKLIIAIKQRNVDILERIFWEVSDPTSTSYGEHLTMDDITKIVAPEESVLDAVFHWLDGHPITFKELTPNKDMLTIKLPLKSAEELLQTEYHLYRHRTGKEAVSSMGPYTAPAHISKHLDFITGHLGLNKVHEQHYLDARNFPRDAIAVTPAIIRLRYNISKHAIGGNPANIQAVAQFQNNFFSQSDVSQFFQQFWPEDNFNSTVQRVIGANDHKNPTALANEDVQTIMGVAPNVPTWYYANDGSDFWSDLGEWLNILAASPSIPLVHSFTSGNQGNGQSQNYNNRINLEFMKLGARGASLLVASGDFGTGCTVCYYFDPGFPATSPYVTTVGSTSFIAHSVGAESATYSFGSGGGFSWVYEQPDYQVKAITHYFASPNNFPEAHFFNREGRGIPDVAALGVDYHIVVNGENRIASGTGVATATFSAVVSLLNEIRLARVKSPLGFLNPLLYKAHEKHPDAFFDVTQGNNHHGCCGYTGFNAGTGWDPVSGLGTPNFYRLGMFVRDDVK